MTDFSTYSDAKKAEWAAMCNAPWCIDGLHGVALPWPRVRCIACAGHVNESCIPWPGCPARRCSIKALQVEHRVRHEEGRLSLACAYSIAQRIGRLLTGGAVKDILTFQLSSLVEHELQALPICFLGVVFQSGGWRILGGDQSLKEQAQRCHSCYPTVWLVISITYVSSVAGREGAAQCAWHFRAQGS